MGSIITLNIGNLQVDWAKNWRGADHSVLFQSSDLKRVPYPYVTDNHEPVVETKEAFSSPVRRVVARLELLGFTLETARGHFVEAMADRGLYLEDPGSAFDLFCDCLCNVNLTATSPDYDPAYDFGEIFGRTIFEALELPHLTAENEHWRRYTLTETLANVDANVALRLLSLNPANAELPVIWQFMDVLEGGWVKRDEIFRPLPQSDRFLIVTEGSSDAKILFHALRLLRPAIADFFYFIDMEEGYPFTGTGNLLNFCRGLAKIGILNKILVLYDNDAEDVARLADTPSLSFPPTMRALRLPNLKRFESFWTTGPQGVGNNDINGKAAAIECYLDLTYTENEQPGVRWTTYNQKLDCYQGELIQKAKYAKQFLQLRTVKEDYDFSGLNAVLDTIVAECLSISSSKFIDEPVPPT